MSCALVFDTETTGLTVSREPASFPGQPHLVQLGVILVDEDTGAFLQRASLIVKPDGWEIPVAASNVHGVTQELAMAVGVPLRTAVSVLTNLAKAAGTIVAHNLDFDELVIAAALHRLGGPALAPAMPRFCTMRAAAPVVGLPPTEKMKLWGFTKHKPPNLGEAVRFFFDEALDGAHDALVDATACARIYLELRKREKETAA